MKFWQILRITTFALTSSLCRTSALRAHLAEGAVTYALYIGAVEQGTQFVVYGTLLDAQAGAQFLGFCRSELRDGYISWNYE